MYYCSSVGTILLKAYHLHPRVISVIGLKNPSYIVLENKTLYKNKRMIFKGGKLQTKEAEGSKVKLNLQLGKEKKEKVGQKKV